MGKIMSRNDSKNTSKNEVENKPVVVETSEAKVEEGLFVVGYSIPHATDNAKIYSAGVPFLLKGDDLSDAWIKMQIEGGVFRPYTAPKDA